MCILSFHKITDKQNILFDEFFIEYNRIDILAFNYDNKGSALCACDGVLKSLDGQRLDKIMFGVHRMSLENYLKAIFDPDSHSDELHRTGGEFIFKTPELSSLKKYDLYNLAKKTLKDFELEIPENYIYFSEVKDSSKGGIHTVQRCEMEFFGNINSKVIHKSSCNNYNPSSCTALFSSMDEASEAGYKPCGICKPT